MVSDTIRRATRSAEVECAAGADGDPAAAQLLGDHGLELVGIGRRGPRPPAVAEQADGDAVLGLAVTAVHHGPGLAGDRTLGVPGGLAARGGADLRLAVAVAERLGRGPRTVVAEAALGDDSRVGRNTPDGIRVPAPPTGNASGR